MPIWREGSSPSLATKKKSMDVLNFIKEANKYRGNLKKCYEMGFDAGLNGANEENCHFSLFATREMTDAWTQGTKDGESIKTQC